MKPIKTLTILFSSVFLLASCFGNNSNIDIPSGELRISADKTECNIEAYKNSISFYVDTWDTTYVKMNEIKLTSNNPDFDSSLVQWNNLDNRDTTRWTYKFTKVGVYEIKAVVQNLVSVNSVTITVHETQKLHFDKSSYTYEYATDNKLEYKWIDNLESQMSIDSYDFVISSNEINATVKWKKNEDNKFYSSYIKADDIGSVSLKVVYLGRYESETVTINFVDTADYTTKFYDEDNVLIKEIVHKHDVDILVPSIDSESFIGWFDGQNIVTLEETIKERKNSEYRVVCDNSVGETFGLKYELSPDGSSYVVTGYNGIDFDVKIPMKHDGKYVTEIAKSAFQNKAITSVTIGQAVKKVGENAFQGTKIEYCNFINGSLCEIIESSAFYNCQELNWIIIPRSVQYVGSNCFDKDSNLLIMFQGSDTERVTFGYYWNNYNRPVVYNVLKFIDHDSTNSYQYVLMGDETVSVVKFISNDLTNVSIDKIDNYVVSAIFPLSFQNNILSNIVISKSVTSIGSRAFYGCTNLKNIDFSEATNLSIIDDYAFYNCTGLTSIDLSMCEKLNTISSYAFYNCSSMNDILISSSVTSIGSYCFDNCSSLYILFESIDNSEISFGYYWNNDMRPVYYNVLSVIQKDLDGNFKYAITSNGIIILKLLNENLKEVNLTTNIDNYKLFGIGAYAFKGQNIESVRLASSCTFIGKSAFYDCANLCEFNINMTSKLVDIDDYAFYGCSNLIAFHIPLSVIRIGMYCFDNCSSLYILFEAMDSSEISLGSYWNNDMRPVSYLVKELKYKNFNLNGSFYYYEMSNGKLGFLKWKGSTHNCGPTTSIEIDNIDGKPFVEICDRAFENCKSYDGSGFLEFSYTKLVTITIGSSVKRIGKYAFSGLYEDSIGGIFSTSETQFKIKFNANSELEYIGTYAFESSHFIGDVILGKNISEIGSYAFGLATVIGDPYKIFIEKGSNAGVSLGSHWNGNKQYYWGTEWHYNQNGLPILNE